MIFSLTDKSLALATFVVAFANFMNIFYSFSNHPEILRYLLIVLVLASTVNYVFNVRKGKL